MDQILDTYKIIRRLGEGSGGIIYLAYHNRLRKEVVLKQIKNRHHHDYKNRREVDILKKLHHTYLPQVFDFIEMNGELYTVMSYVPGKSFEQLIQEGYCFKQNQFIRWGMQLCSALNYLHNQKPPIVHSDIKPSNIMLTPQGNICLIDFNISFFLDGTTMIGYTNGYSSPEQKSIAMNRYDKSIVLDDKTDIYSVGATFYYFITGEKLKENGPNLELLENKVSDSFAQVICKAVSYDKNDRYQSAHEMLKAFQLIPKHDRRYRHLVRTHKIVLSSLSFLLGISIVLSGLGIHEMKLEKIEAYNSIVEEQIAYRKEKNYKKEVEKFKEAKELMPESIECYYQNALSLYEQQSYQECIDFITYDILKNEKLDLSQKKTSNIYYVQGNSYFQLEKYDKAVKSYQKIFKYGGYDYVYYRDYAIALAYNNENEKANDILQKAIDQGMKEDSIYYVKGEISKILGNKDEALNYFQSCLDTTDNDELKERSYLLMSDIYKNQNELVNSRQILNSALESLPVSRQLIVIERLIQVDIDLAQKDNDSQYQKEAITLLNKVIDNKWDTYDTYNNLVVLHEKLGQYDEVQKYLQYMLETFGEDYNIYKRYAFLEIDLQELKKNENRNYIQFYDYYQKAKTLYSSTQKNKNDPEMDLLDNVYQKVLAGGWLS